LCLRWREQPRLKPGYGSNLLVALTGEQLDGASEGGMIRDRELVFWDGIAGEFARSIPAFRLRVSMNGRFWEELDRVLL
jgi:hypothetical protein